MTAVGRCPIYIAARFALRDKILERGEHLVCDELVYAAIRSLIR